MSPRDSLGESARLSDTAFLWPLAAASSAEPPAGIVAVSGAGVRVVDYRLGHADEIAAAAYEPAAETRWSGAGVRLRAGRTRRGLG